MGLRFHTLAKPHISKVPGWGKVWYAFSSRRHYEKCVEELRLGVPEHKRRNDALDWGLTFELTLNRVLLKHGFK